MKICLVQSSITTGSGSGRYMFDLAERFAEDRHDVTLCCHECDEALVGRPHVTVIRLPRPSGRWGTWRLGHVAHLRKLQRDIPGALRGLTFDILIGSDLLFLQPVRTLYGPALPFIYTPLSMIAPIEIASYELDSVRTFLGVRAYARLQRWALEHCDRVARFTKAAVRALEQYYHLDLSRKELVSVYVSREFEGASGPADGAAMTFDRPTPRELLWVGRLIKSKNVGFLLRAVALLKSSDWVLNVCSDGPERQELERLAVSLGIAERVRFLGSVGDLAAVYQRASLLLTGSVLEQYSLTVMEAFAFGVPCLGLKPDGRTVFNSNEDQIADGVTGYVVLNEADMARRIDELLADEAKRQQMARAAYARKQSGFSFESFYKDISDAAVSLAGSRNRAA